MELRVYYVDQYSMSLVSIIMAMEANFFLIMIMEAFVIALPLTVN